MLDERKQLILWAVINDFICNAEPVGSKRLVDQYALDISPATARHELAVLEELGYLSQPHTSAGRVPTDLGYRYYVDWLTENTESALVEHGHVRDFFAELNYEIDQLMKETSHLLASLTSCVALVYAPDIRQENIKHIDLVRLGSNRVMIVVITSNGSLSKQVLDAAGEWGPEVFVKLERVLNFALNGVSVGLIDKIDFEVSDLSVSERALLEIIKERIIRGLAGAASEQVYYDGAAHLLTEPEFGNLIRVREVFELLEQNYLLLEWLETAAGNCEVIVSIGSENELNLGGLSLVASGYEINGKSVGALGVIGPTRMDYPRAISTVKCIARNLGAALAEIDS